MLPLTSDQHDGGSVGDELHPLGHVVGADVLEHELIADIDRREDQVIADDVDVHAQRPVHDRRLGDAPQPPGRDDLVLVPERGEQDVDASIEDHRAPTVGQPLVGLDGGEQEAGVVDQRAAGLEDQLGLLAGRIVELGQALGDRLGVARERGRRLLAGQVLGLELVVRGEAAAEIEEGQDHAQIATQLVGEFGQLGGRVAVGLGLEDEGAQVAMETDEAQLAAREDPADGVAGLTVLEVEAKAGPCGDALGGQVDPDRDLGRDPELLGDLLGERELVEVIEVDDDPGRERLLERRTRLVGPVEVDLVGRDAVAQGLVEFELRHDLGQGALAVHQSTDRVEVVGLVGPSQPSVGHPQAQDLVQLTIAGHDLALGEHEERRAVALEQQLDRHALDVRHRRGRLDPRELVHHPHLVTDEGGSLVGSLGGRGLVLGHGACSRERWSSPWVAIASNSDIGAI